MFIHLLLLTTYTKTFSHFFNLNFIKKCHTYKSTYTYSFKKETTHPALAIITSSSEGSSLPSMISLHPSNALNCVLIISLLFIYHIFNSLVLTFTEKEPQWMYSSATCFFHHLDSSMFTCVAVVQSDFCGIPLQEYTPIFILWIAGHLKSFQFVFISFSSYYKQCCYDIFTSISWHTCISFYRYVSRGGITTREVMAQLCQIAFWSCCS